MRPVAFAAIFFAPLMANSQDAPPSFNDPNATIKPATKTLSVPSIFSHSIPGGNQVYTLTQDNMPCVVPDMQQYNMPNASTSLLPGAGSPGSIPNPGLKTKPIMKNPAPLMRYYKGGNSVVLLEKVGQEPVIPRKRKKSMTPPIILK